MPLHLSEVPEWLFPRVTRPNRYIAPFSKTPDTSPADFPAAGGELCLVFPGPYEDAYAHAEWRNLLETLRSQAHGTRAHIDVCHTPEEDFQAALREAGIDLFGFATRRPLKDYRVLVLYAATPLDVLEGLRLAHLGGVSLAKEGAYTRLVLVGPAALFPETFDAYFDYCFAGDPECFVSGLLALAVGEAPEQKGVNQPGVECPVEPQWLDRLPTQDAAWVPLSEINPEALPVELVRTWDSIPRPHVLRPVADGLQMVRTLLAKTGYAQIALSPASGEHPDLVEFLERFHQPEGATATMHRVPLKAFSSSLGRELSKCAPWPLNLQPLDLSGTNPVMLENLSLVMRGPWRRVTLPLIVDANDTPKAALEFAGQLKGIVTSNQGPRLCLELRSAMQQPWVPGIEPPSYETFQEIRDLLRSKLPKRLALESDDRDVLGAQLQTRLWNSSTAMESALETAIHGQLPVRRNAGLFVQVPEDSSFLQVRRINLQGSQPPRGHDVSATAGVSFAGPRPAAGRRVRRVRPQAGLGHTRYRVRFVKDESVRFISHLETGRTLERALRGAALPVALSNGKHRRPQIGYGPPLPVGMTSDVELVDLTFSKDVGEGFSSVVNGILPEGFQLLETVPIHNRPESLAEAVAEATYLVCFPSVLVQRDFKGISHHELHSAVKERLSETLESQELQVTRRRKNQLQTLNARPSVKQADVELDQSGSPALRLRLTLNQSGSVRPEAVTAAICNWTDFDQRLLRVHRSGLHVVSGGVLLDPLEVVHRDFAWWKQTEARTAAV